MLAWKRRSGFAQYIISSPWEQRWLVIAGSTVSYYTVGEEDKEPRGTVDLLTVKNVNMQIVASNSLSEHAPSQHQVDFSYEEPKSDNTTDEHSEQAKHHAPRKTHWKLCFDNQQDLMQFLGTVHDVMEKSGQIPQAKDADRFEHDFSVADHIYRWEMIVCPPVIYPIQIHGIVLEAGRNCLVVADFGLTGYARKKGEDFNHADDRHHNIILEAWRKLRPKDQNQRLNIVTLTDPYEIRKWFRANYEDPLFDPSAQTKKLKKITGFMSKLKLPRAFGDDSSSRRDDSSSRRTEDGNEAGEIVEVPSEVSTESTNSNTEKHISEKHVAHEELPKSDPKEIVLARANFLLEHEDVLPPYHVFFSNSECIAVWCKTGRWSTLQTAVFLASNSVGGAKSATLATIGIAAAHAVLAPVVAVGGLIWVSAPMVILKRSREKWEEATWSLTELFWNWAPPAIYVAAIENWSGLTMAQEKAKEKQEKMLD